MTEKPAGNIAFAGRKTNSGGDGASVPDELEQS
jgi:hypothetical protein